MSASESSVSAVAWSDKHATPTMPTSRVVFTSGSTITIAAPKELVWRIMLDFDKYGEWNTWCPRFDFPQGEEVRVGSVGKMFVNMEAQKKMYEIGEKILVLDETPSKNTLAWAGLLIPTWAGKAERVQELTTLPSDEEDICQLKQWESMGGWASYIMKYAMGVPKQLDDSNKKYSQDLKARAEALFAQQKEAAASEAV